MLPNASGVEAAMVEWEHKRLSQGRNGLAISSPAYALHQPTTPNPQLTRCPTGRLRRREATTKFELPISSEFAGRTEKTCGLTVCAMSMLLPMPGGSRAEDDLAVVTIRLSVLLIAGYASLAPYWMDMSFNSYPLWVQSELSSLHHTSCL